MTERIDHAAEARKHIEWAHAQQEVDGEFDFSVRDNALIAQAEASLAIAEQLRIGNLISLAQGGHGASMGLENIALNALRTLHTLSEGPFPEQTVQLRPEIAAALGVSNE